MAKYEKFADAVRIQYLHYQEKYKNKLKTNDYLKHVPPSLTPIHEYSDEMGMLFLNNKSNELIYALRGLDFDLIQQNIPSVTLGSSIGSLLGSQMSSGRQNKYLQNTGKLIGGLAGGYAFGNKEVRSAIDIIVGGIDNSDNKEVNSKFINEYQSSLNMELFKLREIQSNFPNTKLILTGHSRGGILASDLSKVLNLEAHLFNPAESSVFSNLLLQMALPILTSSQDNNKNNKNNKYDYSLLGDNVSSNNKNAVSYKNILQVAEKYSSLRDNGLLKKYTLDETNNNLDLINPFNMVGQKSITSSFINPEDRIIEANKNISIHRTENDLVSMGYSDIYNVDLRAEVEASFIERIIGDHNIDHFISDNLFNSIKNDNKIEPYEEQQVEQQVLPYQPYKNDNIFINLSSPRFASLNPYSLCLESGNELECRQYL